MDTHGADREPPPGTPTAGLEPYPHPARRIDPAVRPRPTSPASLAVIGVSLALAAAWAALAVVALLDYSHAGEGLGSVGASLAAMFDVIGVVVGVAGAACALGGAAAWLAGRCSLAGGLLLVSVASPMIVGTALLGWILVVPG